MDGLVVAFGGYARRAVLERCPHCGPPVRVDECDLFWLSIKLGNTVGGRDDVKALLPMLFGRLITSDELDAGIVLGKLQQEQWGSWPLGERRAVEEFLDAVWRRVLGEFPARVGAFTGAREFLGGVASAGIGPARFLTAWESIAGCAADRHLAALVNEMGWVSDQEGAVVAWLRREVVQERLFRAYERDHAAVWADDFARAYDLACLL
ncbi:MAG: hypothetical protein JWN03_7235 [Nocardia sp.]|uniref:hypothetical protein n=1 Tax=Nocardia sp. TaxID=1821 RepID=UPI0026274B2A|nr:hypothetical protein [Nocardia sp.]MCU1646960.1 hypothetical protein [Nocardia sp.]